MHRTILHGLIGVVVLAGLMTGCGVQPGDPLVRMGDEIVAAGQFFHTGTPVVLWLDPNGYDAYRARRRSEPGEIMPKKPVSKDDPNRYSATRRNLSPELRASVDEQGWTLENLQQQVDQFVIHYDVCGTSARCFYILHDYRGLSVHFMLDVDGTIYQALDLKERAWHGNHTNDRSIGIEIAQIGAYRDMKTLNEWYDHDESDWPYVTFPDWMTDPGIRTPDFVARPARREVIEGTINGTDLMQYDFTNEQYAALEKLTATLCRIFPKLEPSVPRDSDGNVIPHVLDDDALSGFSGLIGHWHVIKSKTDPGPAFDWDRLIGGVRQELGMAF